jgi:hypothetical protein
MILSKTMLKLNHMIIMKNNQLDEDKIKFSKIITEKKWIRVLIEERNDKLPFAVYQKRIKVNHNRNFIFLVLH